MHRNAKRQSSGKSIDPRIESVSLVVESHHGLRWAGRTPFRSSGPSVQAQVSEPAQVNWSRVGRQGPAHGSRHDRLALLWRTVMFQKRIVLVSALILVFLG